MNGDKQAELSRYDSRARDILVDGKVGGAALIYGALACPPVLRSPYSYYEQCIRQHISHHHDVLELGSGTGMHTYALLLTGARVVASDISSKSLVVLSQRLVHVKTAVADMEALPFADHSFDVITSAGSLSYGDPALVDAELSRVLRPGGIFICVDSLNHNPVYRLNRWLHYKRGVRTQSTLLRMPTLGRIATIAQVFAETYVRYFGTMTYLMPILARIIGQNRASAISDYMDQVINVHRSAFKFVLVAKGRL